MLLIFFTQIISFDFASFILIMSFNYMDFF